MGTFGIYNYIALREDFISISAWTVHKSHPVLLQVDLPYSLALIAHVG